MNFEKPMSIVSMLLSLFTYLVPVLKPDFFDTPEKHIIVFLVALIFNIIFLFSTYLAIYKMKNDAKLFKDQLEVVKEQHQFLVNRIEFLKLHVDESEKRQLEHLSQNTKNNEQIKNYSEA